MGKIMKRKWKAVRAEFKDAITQALNDNAALALAVVKTYSAHKQRCHIFAIWHLLGMSHKEAWKDYCENLHGKYITGKDEIFHTLYFAAPDIYERFNRRLPERIALGVAYGAALRTVKKSKR